MKLSDDLRRSVLQAAIQGKLTEQRPEDGNAENLLKEIRAEKKKLIAEGKIKKEKPLPPITDDEKPFDIPDNWAWVRLGEIINIVSSRRVHEADWKKQGIPFYRAREIVKLSEYGYVNNELFISEDLFNQLSKSGLPSEGDLMITAVGTLGKIYIVKKEDKFYYKDATVLCLKNFASLSSKYIRNVITSDMFLKQIANNSSGTTVATLTIIRMNNYIFPLPPLAEQERIVEQVEKIMKKIDELDKAETELEALEKKFPGDMRDSLLQAAIQGKLTKQRPEDGNAEDLLKQIRADKKKLIAEGKIKKEKPLPPIDDDKKPFDIPNNWVWVRLGDIGRWQAGSTPPKTNSEFYGGKIPWLITGDLNDGFINEQDIKNRITEKALAETSVKMNPKGSVLIAMYGATIGKTAILNIQATTNQACCACLPMHGIFNKYLFFVLQALKQTFINMGEGGAQPNISKEKIIATLFPLPPLAEQKRIVERLNELLPLCEAMKGE